MRRGPLSNSYLAAVGLVVFSLVPYLGLTAAVIPLSNEIAKSLHLSTTALYIAISVSAGAYSAGTVLAVQMAVHLPARRMLVVYEALFVVASVLAASAPDGAVFVAAFIVQGLCTSLLLIAAVPPLVTAWPAEKMPTTAGIMNLCIFGAVAVGPSVGAWELSGGAWRPLFWVVAGLAVLALLFSLLTFEDQPPLDRSSPVDLVALTMAVVGCGASFYGAGALQSGKSVHASSVVPLAVGFALLVALVVYEYRIHRPLMPVEAIATSVPVTGIFIALTTSAAAFGLMELILQMLKTMKPAVSPGHTALLFLPEFVAAVLVAGVFGVLFRTRYTPVLAIGGLLLVVSSAAVLIATMPTKGPAVAVSTGLLGLGVGASVSPALFMAGLSLPAKLLQRVFAMIELSRGVTAFLVAPILIFLASVIGTAHGVGLKDAVWICLGIAVFGFIGSCVLYLTGRPRLEVPDLERWQGGVDDPAWSSPPLFSAARRTGGRQELDLSDVDRAGSGDGPQPEPAGSSPAAGSRDLAAVGSKDRSRMPFTLRTGSLSSVTRADTPAALRASTESTTPSQPHESMKLTPLKSRSTSRPSADRISAISARWWVVERSSSPWTMTIQRSSPECVVSMTVSEAWRDEDRLRGTAESPLLMGGGPRPVPATGGWGAHEGESGPVHRRGLRRHRGALGPVGRWPRRHPTRLSSRSAGPTGTWGRPSRHR